MSIYYRIDMCGSDLGSVVVGFDSGAIRQILQGSTFRPDTAFEAPLIGDGVGVHASLTVRGSSSAIPGSHHRSATNYLLHAGK
jgi:hypothetical protein